MCTVVTQSRPGHAWPLLLAANRDEMIARAWDPPAAHWPDRPGLIAGRDREGGGTWMALRGGLVACVLNRPGSLGPAPGLRSRGELPLLALESGSAKAACDRLAALDGGEYRPFNMVIADRGGAWFVRGDGDGTPHAAALPPGLHMVTAHDPDDVSSPRVARHLPRFRAAPAPEPCDWRPWLAILADDAGPREAALHVPPLHGFGTVCASVLGLRQDGTASWLFGPSAKTLAALPIDELVAVHALPA